MSQPWWKILLNTTPTVNCSAVLGAVYYYALASLHTCSRMVFLFLPSVTVDSCMSPIFFIFSSMSIFCSSLRISVRSSRTVSSLWCCRARAAAHAEWIAVIQFSSSVWPEVWQEQRKLHGMYSFIQKIKLGNVKRVGYNNDMNKLLQASSSDLIIFLFLSLINLFFDLMSWWTAAMNANRHI